MKLIKKQIVIPMLLVLITAACTPSQQQAVPTATNTLMTVNQDATLEPAAPTSEAIATITVEPERVIMPTSRGPNLVATDPSGVKLASGQLQLVEFFRFT